MREIVIRAENVSVKYLIAFDRIRSIKEYIIQRIKKNVHFEEFLALQSVNLEVRKGEVVGIIGDNGAGKSTFLKVVSGIIKPSEGKMAVSGVVVPLLELGSGFDFDLTGRENIFLNGAILGYSEDFLNEKYDQIVAFSGLGKFIDVPLRNYSSGMIIRLAFSVATVVNPDILIVDEILAVGDLDFQEKSKQRMRDLMSGGTTVLFVSHNLEQVKQLCDRVVWLEHGVVQMDGKTEDVCAMYEKR